jgi:hypothetical protein
MRHYRYNMYNAAENLGPCWPAPMVSRSRQPASLYGGALMVSPAVVWSGSARSITYVITQSLENAVIVRRRELLPGPASIGRGAATAATERAAVDHPEAARPW